MACILRVAVERASGTLAPVLIFLAFGSPSFSQSAAPADREVDLLQEAAAPEPVIEARKFDDWYYRCTGAAGAKACEVAQVAQVAKDGKNVTVLTLAISAAPADPQSRGKSRLILTALLPLNVFLPSGLSLKADGKPVAKLAYRNCNQSGCWAQQALDTKTIAALKKGMTAEGLVRLINGQDINIRFSLSGLKPALDELQSTASR
ncbi:invasion associated locus B family protein (plasmid) [Sinorhizobium sp. B11]